MPFAVQCVVSPKSKRVVFTIWWLTNFAYVSQVRGVENYMDLVKFIGDCEREIQDRNPNLWALRIAIWLYIIFYRSIVRSKPTMMITCIVGSIDP